MRPTRFARSLAPLLALLLLGACVPGLASPRAPADKELGRSLDAIFAGTPQAHAHWGVLVRDLESGATLYDRNAEKTFVPASTLKLVTGAAALHGLGPDYRYATQVLATGPVRNGVLQGDLVVWGSGDPTISERFTEDARATFRAWADSLRLRGVQRIAGGIVGVDDAFDEGPGSGWMWDDLAFVYAAEVSGLTLNEGAIRVRLFPAARVGEPALLDLTPATGYLRVENRTRTVPAGEQTRVTVERAEDGLALVVEGEVPLDATSVERQRSVPGPTGYFVTVLRETLREAGIQVEGTAIDADDREEPVPSAAALPLLFTHRSPPLAEILPAMLKPSQNQIAEALLKTLGAELRGAGTARAGAEAADSLLRSWGIDTRLMVMADGSGMSRYDLATPELFVALLAHMQRSPHAEIWLASLPVAATDGTLASRFRDTPAAGRVQAKTGTMTAVAGLAGYATTVDGRRLAFAIVGNNHVRTAAEARAVMDSAVVRMVAGADAPRN